MSTHAQEGDSRFRRVAYGVYEYRAKLPVESGRSVLLGVEVGDDSEQTYRVEELLGAPIPFSAVNEALSTHAVSDQRFRRVRYGVYEHRW
jgi:hypothetical protein